MRYVTIDNAYIFSRNPDAISPQPKNFEGQPVFHVGASIQREDGYACAVLSDGSRITSVMYTMAKFPVSARGHHGAGG